MLHLKTHNKPKKEKRKTLSEQKHLVLSQTRVGPTWLMASRVKPDDWIPKMFWLLEEDMRGLQPSHTNPIPVGLFFLNLVLIIYFYKVLLLRKNTWKEVGWQILVSQTLEASPSALCKREAKQRKEKQTDNNKRNSGGYYISQSIGYPFARLQGKVYLKVRGTERSHYSEIEV